MHDGVDMSAERIHEFVFLDVPNLDDTIVPFRRATADEQPFAVFAKFKRAWDRLFRPNGLHAFSSSQIYEWNLPV